MKLEFRGEIEREVDGRWIAEIIDLPGVMAYGTTREEAKARCLGVLLDTIADQLANGEMKFPDQKMQALEVAYA